MPSPLLLTTLFTTGSTVAEGAIDPNWTLTGTIPGGYAPSLTVATNGIFPLTDTWLANNATSKWLVPNGTQANHVPGNYNFSTSFNLSGFAPTTTELIFRFTVDNSVTGVSLNGNSLGISSGGFTAFTSFFTVNNTTNPGVFQNGTNTLTFEVNNVSGTTGNPSGLRVEITGTANAVVVPEAGTLALVATGFASFGLLARRRTK